MATVARASRVGQYGAGKGRPPAIPGMRRWGRSRDAGRRRSAACIGVLALIACSAPLCDARAGNPLLATYAWEPDQVFWFVLVADTHIGSLLTNADGSLKWVLGQAYEVIAPDLVFVAGDLTESNLAFGQNEQQWKDYRKLMLEAGADESFLVDMPGNHDQYGDGDLSYYLEYGIQGVVTGDTQTSVVLEQPYGKYHFVSVCTAGDDGANWPMDHAGLNDEELSFVSSVLTAQADARLTFVIGHHPVSYFDDGEAELEALLAKHSVSAYGYGHTHDYDVDMKSGTLHLNLDTLGKGSKMNFAIFAVDHDVVSVAVVDQEKWPIVVVTAPADASLGGENPYAPPVPAFHAENPVRALVFSPDPVTEVRFRVDGEPETHYMEKVASGPIWQGSFDSTLLATGTHDLEVVAVAKENRKKTIQFVVDVLGCADAADNDDDGLADYPDDPGCASPADDDETDPPPPVEPGPEEEPGPEGEDGAETAPPPEDSAVSEQGPETVATPEDWAEAVVVETVAPLDGGAEPAAAESVAPPEGVAETEDGAETVATPEDGAEAGEAEPDDGAEARGGAESGTTDAGRTGGDAGAPDDLVDAAGPGDDGGCGCNASPSGPGGHLLLIVVLLGVVVLWRRSLFAAR